MDENKPPAHLADVEELCLVDDCHEAFHDLGVHAPGYVPRHREDVPA